MSFFSILCKELDARQGLNENPPRSTYEAGQSPCVVLSSTAPTASKSPSVAPSTTRSSPSQPQKRKRTAGNEEQTTKASKTSTTLDPACEQSSDLPTAILHIATLAGCTTAASYAHGPRSESRHGPIIPYSTHAAMLKGKLQALLHDKARLDEMHDSANKIFKEATRRLREHNADQGNYLNRRGGSMEKWRDVRSGIQRSLKAAEAQMEIARRDAKKRGVRLTAGDDADDNSWCSE